MLWRFERRNALGHQCFGSSINLGLRSDDRDDVGQLFNISVREYLGETQNEVRLDEIIRHIPFAPVSRAVLFYSGRLAGSRGPVKENAAALLPTQSWFG